MSEGTILKILFNEYNKDVLVPNVYWLNCRYEMDMARVTQAGYLYEYEVKTSVADFRNEFKKRKKRKHALYLRDTKRVPHYYTVVTDCGQITGEMVQDLRPDYGLIHIIQDKRYKTSHRLKQILKPKLLKKTVYPMDFRKLARKLSFKLFNNAERFN